MMRGQRFSFSRLITNSFPNMARDDPHDVDLSPTQADNLLRYQLSLPSPRYLAPLSFFMAGITGSESLSAKVHKALVKGKLILPVPVGVSESTSSGAGTGTGSGAGSGVENMTVNTAAIGRGFASQLAAISVHAQRKLVGLLFFWEEECTRWALLDAEEREIRAALDEGGNGENVDLRCALAAVEMRRRMLPSRRAEGVANVVVPALGGSEEELPGYQARR